MDTYFLKLFKQLVCVCLKLHIHTQINDNISNIETITIFCTLCASVERWKLKSNELVIIM